MSVALEIALVELRIEDRDSEAARHVAMRIITLAKHERDAAKLRERVLEWYRREAVPA